MAKAPRPAHRPREKVPGAFARWIESTGKTYKEIAEILDCSVQAISNVRKGHYPPGRALANRIAVASKGMVPVATWDRKVRS